MKTIPHHNKIILGLTLANVLFLVVWVSLQLIDDVYSSAWLGTLFELIWLPTIALLFASAVVSLGCWIKQSFSIHSTYVYLFLSSLMLVYLLVR